MNSNNNTGNDNHCQHPDGCMKSLFTYCPHCYLYLCIIHLNEHHDTIEQTKHDAENHRVSLEQQIYKIKQQQTELNDLYERELKNLNDIHQLITNICENNYLVISNYERYAQQLQSIKQDQENNSFIQSFTLQIDQILQQQNHIDGTTNILSISDNETTTDICSESCVKEEDDSPIDCHSDELSITVVLDSDTSPLQPKSPTKPDHSSCPLFHVNAFGFSIDHNIPGVPCNYSTDSTTFKYNRRYYHLISYHCLRPRVVRLIMKTISENKNKDPITLDIFSHWKSTDILSQATSLFVGQCPLVKKNVYGLQNQHNMILCRPRLPLRLYQHLCSFHHFKPKYARRLTVALIQNKSPKEELFKPNEQILNDSSRSKKRTKK